jgi:transposase
LPSETVQELRTLTRARRDLGQSQTAAKQRLRDELVVLFPALPDHTPEQCDLFAPALLHVLETYSSAHAWAQAPLEEVTAPVSRVSDGGWTAEQAAALQHLAQHSAASQRAVAARSLVVRTMARHLLDLQQHLADRESALGAVLAADMDSQRLQTLSGIGPIIAATLRAELGDVTRFQGVDQAIAYAGLDPRTVQSGAFIGQKHLSKRGPGALRHALYLAAMGAVRCRPEWRARYQRLLDRGRPTKEALTILSRAVLKVVYHVLRTGTFYDPAALATLKPCPARGRA